MRAVDTATHSDARGKAVFTALTLRALEELDADVAFVFNTPNEQSRPGYLKMGWKSVGRLPLAVRPTSARAVAKMMRARMPAERWSTSTAVGAPAKDVLGERVEVAELLESRPESIAMATRLSPQYLSWRYASHPIDYRAFIGRGGVRSGLAIFRVRRRGPARELVICDVLVAEDDARLRLDLLRRLAGAADADYLIVSDGRLVSRPGFVRLPGQGPILTSRPLGGTDRLPSLPGLALCLGDVELF